MSPALGPTIAALAGALLSGGVAQLARPWVRRGGHRVVDDGELDAPPRAGWLVPAAVLVGATVGWVRVATGSPVALALLLAVVAGLLAVLSVIDIDVHRLPDKFTGPMFLGTAAALALLAVVTGDWASWRRALLAGIVLGGVYLVLFILGGGSGMGFGDVKLAPTLGMLLGALSWSSLLAGTMAAFLTGGLVAAVLLLTGRAQRSSSIPFGPAMAAGAVLVWMLPPLAF